MAESSRTVTIPQTAIVLEHNRAQPSLHPLGIVFIRRAQSCISYCSLMFAPHFHICILLDSQGNWLLVRSWKSASLEVRELFLKTKQLTENPELGFTSQMFVTVADALLVDSAAVSNKVAVAVLQQRIAGTAGRLEDLHRVRMRLMHMHKGLKSGLHHSEKRFSPESVAQRLAAPFFMPDATAYPELRTVAQQAKVDAVASAKAEAESAARAKADAARPGERYCCA